MLDFYPETEMVGGPADLYRIYPYVGSRTYRCLVLCGEHLDLVFRSCPGTVLTQYQPDFGLCDVCNLGWLETRKWLLDRGIQCWTSAK